MFSNPTFSKIDAAVIAVLLCGGAAALVESHHRVLIVAPTDVEEVSSLAGTNERVIVRPVGEPMLAPADPQISEPEPFPPRVSGAE